jgi:hypothetical protein
VMFLFLDLFLLAKSFMPFTFFLLALSPKV